VAPAANCGLVIPGVVPPGPTSPIRSAPAGVGRCFPFRSKRPASGEFEDKGWLEAHRCPSNRTAATDGIRTAEASAPVAACCAPWKWPTLTRLSPRAPRSFAQSFGIRLSSVRGVHWWGQDDGCSPCAVVLTFRGHCLSMRTVAWMRRQRCGHGVSRGPIREGPRTWIEDDHDAERWHRGYPSCSHRVRRCSSD
jgi:hypothetical protein